jgi:hypothetical protein
MRDYNRIRRILQKIMDVWGLNPDLRFFQVVELIKMGLIEAGYSSLSNEDFFYLEDGDLEKYIDRYMDSAMQKSINEDYN